MNHIFRAFVDTLNDNTDISALRSAMGDIVAAFELNCFAYMFAPLEVDAEVKLISNYPSARTA